MWQREASCRFETLASAAVLEQMQQSQAKPGDNRVAGLIKLSTPVEIRAAPIYP
jgi:hypothetical protein